MDPENAAYAFCGALVDELVRCGVRHVSLCPGSRSAPLALSAARHPGLRVWVLLDERGAGFFALGAARALRAPVAVLSTSGTAAANFLPVVLEARYGGVPLVVLTADRPHELREFGALQAVDQVRLFGPHAKWFADLPLPEADEKALRYVRSLAARAVAEALAAPAGPVHLNVPLREPLVPVRTELPPVPEEVLRGRPEGRPYTLAFPNPLQPDPEAVRAVADAVGRTERGLMVCGPLDRPGFPQAVASLARASGYPILAEPLAQLRCGPHDRLHLVGAYEPLLRVRDVVDRLRPEVVLRFGATPTSRVVQGFLARCADALHVLVQPGGPWQDPDHVAHTVVHADPEAFCTALAQQLSPRPRSGYLEAWLALGEAAQRALDRRVAEVAEPFEGRVFWELDALLPDGCLLFVGNSMPVRDLDAFLRSSPKRIRVLANRGTSGIDGVVGSALGAAAVAPGPVVLVVGDVSLCHDLNGLLAAKRFGLSALVVLLHNDGGGIFSFLPQAEWGEAFEELFGTPHGLEFRPAVEMFGGRHRQVQDWAEFRAAVREGLAEGGLQVVEVRTDRARNVALHREVWAAVEQAVGAVAVRSGR
jgi:2-succinyl-5-enolpyruvyl-6-hydroxy-3-cyclohexene-1-carboxylate synthase